MSKKNERKEKTGTANKKSRRDFIRNSALGATGLFAALHLSGTERVLARIASRHAGDFFSKARDIIPNDVDAAAFTDVFSQVMELVESNPTYRENMERIFRSITENGGPFSFTRPLTTLGLHTDTSNLLTAGYLGSIASLREAAPKIDLITRVLSDPAYVNQFIEPGFINSLYTKANAEVASNTRYARNARSAASQLERHSPADDNEPCTISTYVQGEYVGQTPCWQVVVVFVIFIIVLVVKISDN